MSAISRTHRVPWQLVVVLLLAAAACSDRSHVTQPPAPRPLIVFMTDFGTLDDAVAICKGVMLGIAPEVEVIDITHQVTPYSISEGARLLARTAPYFPAGTVFVTVIDPGVGTSRRSVVVKTKHGQFFVLPDNGLITPIADRDGIEEVRLIENPAWLLPGSTSSTFHGRDIYSPVAAHLAHGMDWTLVGSVVQELARVEVSRPVAGAHGIAGVAVAIDGPFGNLVTNIGGDEFRGLGYRLTDLVRIQLAETELVAPFASTFGDVAPGKPLLFVDSRGLVSLAINQGNFAEVYKVKPPVDLVIRRK